VEIRGEIHISTTFSKIVLIISANQTRKTANSNHSHSASVAIVFGFLFSLTLAEWLWLLLAVFLVWLAEIINILRSSRKTVLIPCQANSNELIKCLFFPVCSSFKALEREMGFLAVHGFLHLNGYDHMEPEDEKEMFGLQKEILDAYGLKR
jgi:hypothetical protein